MKHIVQSKNYFLLTCGAIFVFSFLLAACSFLEVDTDGLNIKGDAVELIYFTEEEHTTMQQIFTRSNPIMREYIDNIDKLSEEVILIGSEKELIKFCPDSITPPNIDFQNRCLIVGLVVTPTSRSDIKEIELYVQDNGDATFYTRIISSYIDGVKGIAFPYAVFAVPANKINNLEILSRVSFY